MTVTALAFCGALTNFLRYNFNPASIFLGDSGALFVGFTLAALSVTGSQKASTAVAVAIPLMAFALPIVDTSFAIARRFIGGRPIFTGDREHIHHKLLERGWSQRRVALVLYGVCALFGAASLFSVSDGGGRTTGLLLLVTGAALVLVAGRLRYIEVDEVRAGLRRNITERRTRAANHVRVRRACRALSRVARFPGRTRSRSCSPPCETCSNTASSPTPTSGYINFYRELGDDGLLLDVNYLSNLFQREMALAAKRILEGERLCPSLDRLVVSRSPSV